MHTTINDSRILACEDEWSLEMSLQAIVGYDDKRMETLERALGVLWLKSDAIGANEVGDANAAGTGVASDRVRFPLAAVLRPDILKEVQNWFSPKQVNKDVPNEAQSMFNLPKEEFLGMLGSVPEFKATGMAKGERPDGFADAPTRKLGPDK